MGYFEQALQALRHLPDSRIVREQAIDLWLNMRVPLTRLGAQERSLDVIREAEMLSEALGDRKRRAQVASWMANSFWAMGDHDRALAAGQRGHALAQAIGDVELQVWTNNHLGTIYYARGDYQQALEVLGQSMKLLTGAGRRERFSRCLPLALWPRFILIYCMCLAQMGAFVEGHTISAEALQVAEAAQPSFTHAVVCFGIGDLALYQGTFARAISMLEDGLAICRAKNIVDWLPRFAASLGRAYALAGRLSEALALLDQGVKQSATVRGGGPRSLFVAWQSEAYLSADCLAQSQPLAQQSFTLAHARKARGDQAWALRLLGKIAAQVEPPESAQAEAYYRQALTLANELGMRPLQAHCHLGLGTLYNQMGRAQQARTALGAAIELYRTMEMTFWLPQAEAALAQVA